MGDPNQGIDVVLEVLQTFVEHLSGRVELQNDFLLWEGREDDVEEVFGQQEVKEVEVAVPPDGVDGVFFVLELDFTLDEVVVCGSEVAFDSVQFDPQFIDLELLSLAFSLTGLLLNTGALFPVFDQVYGEVLLGVDLVLRLELLQREIRNLFLLFLLEEIGGLFGTGEGVLQVHFVEIGSSQVFALLFLFLVFWFRVELFWNIAHIINLFSQRYTQFSCRTFARIAGPLS